MQLTLSRNALRQATQAVENLWFEKDQSALVRDAFPFVMAAVQRVGSIIDHETKGHRTPEFGGWWKSMQDDPLFVFMRDVRNAEFKRGESREAERRSVELFVTGRGELNGLRGVDTTSASPLLPPRSIDWYFWGGGKYDGQEVFPLLDRYLAWLRDDILPTAERLTR